MKEAKYCIICGNILDKKIIEGKIRKYCTFCGYVHYINPIPIVAVVVKNNKGEILVVKRGIEPEKGKWVLPGGFVDEDESPEQAAIRELKEETNLHAEKVKFIKLVSTKSPLYGPVLMLGYEAINFTGKIKPGDDAIDVMFKKIKNINFIAFKSHRKILKEYCLKIK
jgi:ADP-ribose pyrophosphatase YjhB (NUDIX family)